MHYKQIKDLGPSLVVEFTADAEEINSVKISLSETKELQWRLEGDQKFAKAIDAWMESYLKKEKTLPKLPLPLNTLTPFTQKVYAELANIAPGNPLTYSEVADKIGHERAYRAVGTACAKNRWPLIIPCHRVLASSGKLGGYTGGIEIKKRLLAFEREKP